MTIHKEGYSTILIAVVILAAINIAATTLLGGHAVITMILLLLSGLVFLLVLNFFRSPHRVIDRNENHVLARADGKIVVIEETTETEVLKDRRMQISIFMSPLNVHINR